MNIYKIALVALLGLLFTQCQKDDDLGNTEYLHFMTKLNIDYQYDTISLGDTIWVQSQILGSLTDSASEKKIHFSSANINVNLHVRAWNLANQHFDPKFCSFDFTNYTSFMAHTNKATMVGVYYTPDEGKYNLKLGVVFHAPGTFSIDVDYLKFKNYFTNTDEFFGGGIIEYYDLEKHYDVGYIIADIVAENHNLHLYNNLQEDEKNSFQIVDTINESKYFFIKVNE